MLASHGTAGRRSLHSDAPRDSGTTWYHRGMAKTQHGWRVDPEIAKLARIRAEELGLSIGDYIGTLVQEDVSGLKRRGLEAASRFLEEHQSLFDAAENDASRQTTPGAHAA